MTSVVSYIGYKMTHEIMHSDADRILTKTVDREALRINNMLGDIANSVKIMEHYATTELRNPNDLHDEEYRNEYIAGVKTLFGEISLSTIGAESMSMRLDPQFAGPKSGFYTGITDEGTFVDYDLTDFSKYMPGDMENLGWYYGAVNAGKAIWVEPYYDEIAGMLLISYIVPLYVDDALIGTVGLDVDFSYFINVVNEIAVYDNGFALLYSSDGQTILNDAILPKHEDDEHESHSLVELKNGMKLELRAEYKDIQKNIRPMLKKIIQYFFIVLAVFIVLTILVTKKLVAPLKQLTAATKQVLNGTKIAPVFPVASKDEIGTLSRAFESTYKKLREYTNHINELAYRDSLTGLWNTTAYIEAVKTIEDKISDGYSDFAVIVADMNNLKITNDKYGHEAGNDIIVRTSEVIKNVFSGSEIYRIGGDEFAVILENGDYENREELLKKLDEKCAVEKVVTDSDDEIFVSLARGMATFNKDSDKNYEDVFTRADKSMYLNKHDTKYALGNKR